MPQIFHRSLNTIAKVSIYGAVLFLGLAGWALAVFVRSAYATNVGIARQQPVPFSHQHHVNELGIDCRYCHTSVEDSHFAGVPPTKTCMNCHNQIWVGSQMLAPVRESYKSGNSLQWNRVHKLGEYCYFNHSIHVKKGIGCVSCHGRVDQMTLTWANATLLMEWCLDCHRNPEKNVRPRSEITNMTWEPPSDPAKLKELSEKLKLKGEVNTPDDLRHALAEKYDIRSKITCNACHR
jgi:Cytochrome c7 and related cytochrome c